MENEKTEAAPPADCPHKNSSDHETFLKCDDCGAILDKTEPRGVSLKIIHQPPPNYAAVVAVFPAAAHAGTMFCYRRAIYIPNGGTVSPALQAHESVHADRQIAYPGGPETWWARYLIDAKFRFDEELPAHQAEYRWFDGKPRPERRYMLRQIAARLAGPLYGRMVTPHKAKQLITGKENPDA